MRVHGMPRGVGSSKRLFELKTMKKRAAQKEQATSENKKSKKNKSTTTHHAGIDDHDGTSRFFLMKSEVDVFNIDDLAKKTQEPWDGVRNHQAKKIMMSMSVGDLAFFWASNTKEPGIVGLMKVVKEAYPDETQFDSTSKYYDPKATREHPIWYNVDVALEEKFSKPILLKDLKQYSDAELKDMPLFLMKRLSVQPVPQEAWHFILNTLSQKII